MLYIQKIVRGFLARKQHQPRYRGIIKIKSLKEKLRRSTEIVNQLRGGKDHILKQANDVEHLINGYVKNIRSDSRIPAKTIDKMYTDIMSKIDNYNNMLQSELQVSNHQIDYNLRDKIKLNGNCCPQRQRQAEEQDRLRKIQEALELERKQKEEEERKIREEEENRRK